MSSLHLRDALPADLEAMHRLDQLCFAEPFRFDLPTMRRYASEPNAIALLAHSATTSDPDLLGFVIVNLIRRRALHLAYVTTLDVHPFHRRLGIAATLMRAAEARAAAAQATVLRLHVSTANQDAIRFYEQLGFLPHAFLPGFYGEGFDAHIYSKVLDGSTPGRNRVKPLRV